MSFGTLALIAAIGLLGPLLTLLPARFAPPVVIGEIAAGIAFGNTGTGTIHPTQPTLAFLASIGFALLMFIVGTNLPLRDSRLRNAVSRGALASVVTVGLAIALTPAVLAASGFHKPAVIAVLLTSSSAAVVGPVLESVAESSVILLTLTWVAILDVLTVLAIPFVLRTGSVTRAIIGASLVIVAAVGFAMLARWAAPFGIVGRLRTASHERGWALDLRVSLLVLFFLAWIAESFDTSVLIAGFAAGAMVALLGEPRRVAQQLIGLGEGFFVPLFFVVLGAQINVRSLFESSSDLWLLALLAIGATAAHVITALFTRQPIGAGFVATAQLGVPAAVASVGLASHVLREGQGAAIIGAAAISLIIASIGSSMLGATPGLGPRPTDPEP
jgi:Kef-type K+ transport system membrane component KefB